jgi:Protein of unknown function (DUF982)
MTPDRLLPSPLEIEIAPGRFRQVTTVNGLAELLLAATWPKPSGPVYVAALRACLNCLSDACEPEIPHKAFLKAVKDAGVFIRPGRRGERDR